ncbi:MAG: hypothetical protein HPAVJP_3590 [Candidatus Hepatoplasma vulgare]|nr:MAG: hypothetical protein HPAVJP_3590 [Candidatus Hepatoplasma sp.]
MNNDNSVERRTLSSFFTNGNIYKVPSYQRKYVWDENNTEKLFKDFENLVMSENSSETLYLGNILIKSDENEDKWLIDGQQRITTLLLFFKALYDDYFKRAYKENNHDKEIEEELENYIYLKEDADKNIRLKIKDLINEEKFKLIFEKKININTIPNKKIKNLSQFHKNYFTFRKLIDNFFNKNIEFDTYSFLKIFKKIWIIKIKLMKNDDELKIFETLNSRGTILQAVDLIKNFYFIYTDKIKNNDENLNKKTNYKIKLFFEKILPETISWKGEKTKEFIKLIKEYIIFKSLISENNYNFSLPKEKDPQDLYDKFKEIAEKEFNYLKTNKDIEKSINDLHKFLLMKKNLKKYENINKKYNFENFEISLMIFNKLFTGSQFFPIIAQLMYKDNLSIEDLEYFNIKNINEDFKKAVLYIEKLIVKRESVQKGTRLITRNVNKIKIRSYNDIKEKFKDLLPNNNDFIEGLNFNNIYETIPSDILKGILWRIELNKYDKKSNENINYHNDKDKFTIEHILPQKIEDSVEWKKDLGDDWNSIHEKYKNSLGNLTITGENSEMSNNPFSIKKAHFSNSIIKMNREISKLEKWNKDEILNRRKELIDICLEIWN